MYLFKAPSANGLIAATVLAAGMVFSTMATADADDKRTHRTDFDIRLGALPVGTATFTYEFDENSYALAGVGKTAGLAHAFSPGKGEFKSNGAIIGESVIAEAHSATVVEREKKGQLQISFHRSNVTDVFQKPDKRKKRKNAKKYVVIQDKHLKSVIDPASSLVIPVDPSRISDGKAVCNRTMPIYDGETRYDVRLTYKGTKPVSTTGYDGYAHVCNMRYVPIAGHRKKQRNIEYMRKNRDIDIWLAPMEKTRVFSPIRIDVGTWIGTFTAMPKYFGQG